MPIKFRCVYCNQLLGIARRKAGSTVRCTTCNGELIVPDPAAATELADDGPPSPPPPVVEEMPPPQADGGPLFERDDFAEVLEPFQFRSSGASLKAPVKPSPQSEPRATVSPAPSPAPASPGLSLTRKQVTWAAVVIVIALGVAFAGGFYLCSALH
jgi:hypothetical protein